MSLNSQPSSCESNCGCKEKHSKLDFVVLTGGPGAGKTAVLEFVRKIFCSHVVVLPEAASILFSGGFWRLSSDSAKMSAQRAIYHVQRESEVMAAEEERWALALCDRGSLDGLAYWPGRMEDFLSHLKAEVQTEYAKYRGVIHLRSPAPNQGYNHQNPVRTESAEAAAEIDRKIHLIWREHPNYFVVESEYDFNRKVHLTVDLLKGFIPECCRSNQF